MRLKIFILFFPFAINSGVFSQNVVNQVKIDTLKRYVRELSGDISWTFGGNTFTINRRHTTSQTANLLAADYIRYRLTSYGLTVKEQPFIFRISGTTYNSKNICAVQKGTKYPDKEYIICAHFDAVAESPGADDNGSGTCAVLEVARIISKLSPDFTIIYAFWSGEEQGLYGSLYYASNAKQANENILGVINLDMIAWDKNGDRKVGLFYYNPAGKETQMAALLSKVIDVNQKYSVGMNILNVVSKSEDSDHYSFLYNGYPAFLMIEEDNDFNPYYHSINDKYSNMNLSYFEKCTKLAIGTLAEISGGITSPSAVENEVQLPLEFALHQNYPNPFNPGTIISYDLKAAGYVNLKVYDMLGREVITLEDQFKSAGRYRVNFSPEDKNLTSGIYLYKLQVGGLIQIRKMIYMR